MRRTLSMLLVLLVMAPLSVAALPAGAGTGPTACGVPVRRLHHATFERFSEGVSGPTLTADGITFFDSLSADGAFTVDRADGNLDSLPGFSPDNVLGASGFSPGPEAAFPPTNGFRFATGKAERFAVVHFFGRTGGDNISAPVTLEALWRGTVVASDSVTLTGFDLEAFTLAVCARRVSHLRVTAGQFDTEPCTDAAVCPSLAWDTVLVGH